MQNKTTDYCCQNIFEKQSLSDAAAPSEPYQPHSKSPIGGGNAVTGAQSSVRHHLVPRESFDPPNWNMKH